MTIVAIVGNYFFQVQQKVIAQKLHFLTDLQFPLPISFALTNLLHLNSLFSHVDIQLGFFIKRTTILIIFLSALIELKASMRRLLLPYFILSMIDSDGRLLLLTVSNRLFLHLLFWCGIENFDNLVFAILLLDLLSLLLTMMIILIFVPTVTELRINSQINTPLFMNCSLCYNPNHQSHEHMSYH